MNRKPLTARRWLLRIALSLLALFLLVSAAWVYWSWEMHRRCDAAIAQMRSRGEPVLISDLDLGTVPNDQNALWYIAQAGKPLPATPWSAPWPGRYTAADVTQQANAFALLRKAMQCTRASILDPAGGNPPAVMQFTSVSDLTRLAGDAAILAHKQGDDRAAVERWREMDIIPRSFCKEPMTLIGGLLGVITDRMSSDAMLHLAPTLQIGDASGVPLAEARTLIEQLEDDPGPGEACARGFLIERIFSTDAYLTGRSPLGFSPLQPLRLHYLVRAWSDSSRMAQDCRGISTPAPATVWPQEQQLILGYAIPQFSSVGVDIRWTLARRRLAATALAIRLFHAKEGHYPQSLQELVPDCLTRIPLDPNAPAQRPLGYALLAEGNRPVLWLAGASNATDEASRRGIPATPTGVPAASTPAGTVTYFDASDWAPRTQSPSTQQRAADQHQQPDAPRNQHKPDTQVEQ